MNKKILMSGISIISALAMLGGSAFAAFTVNATSNGSTFSSGNPSLQLCNDSSNTAVGCGNQIASPINVSDLIPGTAKTFYFWIYNTGTDTLSPLSAQFAATGGSSALESDLQVTITCDGYSNNATAGVAAFNVWESLQSLGGTIAPSTASRCTMTVELPSGNTTDVNQTLNFNATFSGTDGS